MAVTANTVNRIQIHLKLDSQALVLLPNCSGLPAKQTMLCFAASLLTETSSNNTSFDSSLPSCHSAAGKRSIVQPDMVAVEMTGREVRGTGWENYSQTWGVAPTDSDTGRCTVGLYPHTSWLRIGTRKLSCLDAAQVTFQHETCSHSGASNCTRLRSYSRVREIP